jgi:hypothetical protein
MCEKWRERAAGVHHLHVTKSSMVTWRATAAALRVAVASAGMAAAAVGIAGAVL